MLRIYSVFRATASKPIEAIEAVIAFAMMVFGIYIASPAYVSTTGTAIGTAFQENMFQQLFVGLVFYIIPALPIILSLFFKRFNTPTWRARGTFMMFIGLVFVTLLRILTIGWFPFVWLFTLTLGLVAGICYLYVRAGSP